MAVDSTASKKSLPTIHRIQTWFALRSGREAGKASRKEYNRQPQTWLSTDYADYPGKDLGLWS